jgi:transcriptional regulator GlxA family with amidase domain
VLRRIVEMVKSSPADNHALPELARNAGLSVRQLTRLFNEHVGATPAAFVASVRLDLARGMLESGHRVGAAARLSGFASDEALRRAFVRRYGVTPSEFRARFGAADLLAESA